MGGARRAFGKLTTGAGLVMAGGGGGGGGTGGGTGGKKGGGGGNGSGSGSTTDGDGICGVNARWAGG